MGVYSLASAERGVALTHEQYSATNLKLSVAGPALLSRLKVSGNKFGGWHATGGVVWAVQLGPTRYGREIGRRVLVLPGLF
jgi:hypothetical protein